MDKSEHDDLESLHDMVTDIQDRIIRLRQGIAEWQKFAMPLLLDLKLSMLADNSSSVADYHDPEPSPKKLLAKKNKL